MEASEIISDAAILRSFAPLEPYPSAALAVSGGADSMALMHLALRWCGLKHRDPASIQVLTVDHGLRPEAKSEADFVKAAAAALGLAHCTLTWTGEKPKAGLQAAARKARYDLMVARCRESGSACLVTAHTEDDQAETVLMRLRRGSGIDGLSAMAPVAEWGGFPLVRPLLGLSKSRLVAYLHARQIAHIEDPTNENRLFERVQIRHLMKAGRRAGLTPAALARSAFRLQRSRKAIDYYLKSFLSRNLSVSPLGNASLNRPAFEAAPEEIALRALARIISIIGGATPAPRLVKLERLLGKFSGGSFETTLGGCLIRAAGEEIGFFREPGRLGKSEHLLEPGRPLVWDDRFTILLDRAATKPVAVRPLGEASWAVYAKSAKMLELSKAPRLPALSTPALWEGKQLISAPLLGWVNPEHPEAKQMNVEVTLLPKLLAYIR